MSTWKIYVRTARQPDKQTDRQTEIFLSSFCLLGHNKHEHSSKGENFFFTHAITILSLFTYSVCDEKVKKNIISLHDLLVCQYTFSTWQQAFSFCHKIQFIYFAIYISFWGLVPITYVLPSWEYHCTRHLIFNCFDSCSK